MHQSLREAGLVSFKGSAGVCTPSCCAEHPACVITRVSAPLPAFSPKALSLPALGVGLPLKSQTLVQLRSG